MTRLVIIPKEEMQYPLFRKVKIALLTTIPFAIENMEYDDEVGGVFVFCDYWYVPEAMKKFINNVPGNDKIIQQLNDKIGKILTPSPERENEGNP